MEVSRCEVIHRETKGQSNQRKTFQLDLTVERPSVHFS